MEGEATGGATKHHSIAKLPHLLPLTTTHPQ